MLGSPFCTCLFISALYIPSCNRESVDVVFYVYEGYTFSQDEQRTVRMIADTAERDARLLLPDLPRDLMIRVNPGRKVIDEIGSSSSHSLPNVIHWTVDPSGPGGVTGIARAHLRATLFFHFHRLTRLQHQRDITLMDHVVGLGMATAFERDAGGKNYPWGEYSGDVKTWFAELTALPASADLNDWLFRHPDGRRWIGMRTGTYIVDQAMRASGKSAAELVWVPTADVVRLVAPAH